MRSDGKTFLDSSATRTAILTRPRWFNCYDRDAMNHTIVGEPREEASPGGIADALCQFPVLDEVSYLEVFIGNQIVR